MINELYEGVCDVGDNEPLTINRHEIQQIVYHTIPEIEEMMALGQVPFTSWFVQLLRWYTGKPADMQVVWARQQE